MSLAVSPPGRIGRKHGPPLLVYMATSVAFTWPLVRNFGGRIIGVVPADPRHSIWLIWHFREWLTLHDSLFYTRMLYYPTGISTLVDGVGPLSGVLALPFCHWGPVAAYNGAILIGFWLTGYCMYCCAIGLGYLQAPAVFSGLVYQLLPMHIAAIDGHIEKTFLGLMPLFMLATIKALDPRSSRRWIPLAALLLLGTLLYTASQFAFCVVALVLTAGAMLWRSTQRRQTARRVFLLMAVSAVVTAPMVIALARVSADPQLNVRLKDSSINFEPDLAQFLVPSPYSAALGGLAYPGERTDGSVFESNVSWLRSSSEWYGSGMDNVVTIYVTVAVLCIIAAMSNRRKRAWAWIAFGLVFIVLALGPRLRVLGENRYGATKPFVMPYGVLTTRVPGFGFMRTPARFILIAGIGLAIAAAIGLQYLRERYPARSGLILAAAVALLLVESWPRQWSQSEPPPVSSFYTRIAPDQERYAIFDLPFEWPSSKLGSLYQYYQLTHRKPIAVGYLSRSYKDYPAGAVNDLMSGRMSGAQARQDLAAAGYRYVVWHKAFQPPTDYEQFAKTILDDQVPVFEDDLIRVYEILPDAARG